MAYVSQELKAELSPAIKTVLKKYSVKGTIAVRHHSTLVVNIKSGVIDFIGNYNEVTGGDLHGNPRLGNIDVNPYWYHDHFSNVAKDFLIELFAAMKGDKWFDRSDFQSDYFHTAYYLDVNIGQWNKPYQVI